MTCLGSAVGTVATFGEATEVVIGSGQSPSELESASTRNADHSDLAISR